MRTLWLLAALLASPARAAQWVHVLDADVLLGQLFSEGKASSWQGNARVQATPAVKFNESLGLIPTYAGSYQGTRSVTELGGGGQLFQDSQSHALHAKLVYRTGALKLKPSLGYRWELLRETRDEGWGKGLFDYRKPSAGLEAEYAFGERLRAIATFDYYEIRFPNYRSLESSQVAAGLGREQAEARTLDTRNYSWSLTGHFPLPFDDTTGRLALNITDRRYPEQHRVVATGQLEARTRADLIRSAVGTIAHQRSLAERIGLSAGLTFALLRADSNQNHYDAELNHFTPEHYSYEERQIQPRMTLVLGRRRAECSFSYLRIDRDYLGRQAQDAAGSYTGRAVHLAQDSFIVDVSVPLRYGLKLRAHTAFTNSRSNVLYEKTYRYNYSIASHLIGFSYSY